MAIPLLKTKLYIPQARPGLVARPRLVERIDEGIGSGRKLTLLSAPAGFGKTTLLGDWIRQADRPAAWVSLDEGDNDPLRFWSYVIAALQAIAGRVGVSLPEVPQGLPAQPRAAASAPRNEAAQIETWLANLINALAGCTTPFALVLDDLHVVTAEQTQNTLLFLLRNLPPPVHLVLSTRADPPWPLARMRARGDMTELWARDLRFTREEAAAFLNEAMKLGLSAGDVTALDARTEGWIAGLQMAALSMREHHDRASFIRDLSGSHRFILDYLVEEVLDRQRDEMRDFMLRTSILGRMNAPLCDAVTGRQDSQGVLARLEQANLFLSPLDEERRWYRYHPLFADLLRSRLRQARPGQVGDLHSRASRWYEQNGILSQAIGHALEAGDVERVVHLIEGDVLAMIEHVALSDLARRLDALPDTAMRAQPWLRVARAWIWALTGQLDAAERLLGDDEGTPGDDDARIAGHVAMVRAYAAAVSGQMPRAAACAAAALELLPAGDAMPRGWALAHLGRASHWSGDLETANRALSEAVAASQAAGNAYLSVKVLCDLGVTQFGQGQLRKAADTLRHAIQLAQEYPAGDGRPLPVAGYAHNQLAELLCEWNDLDAALRHVQTGIALCTQWGQADLLAGGYMSLAEVRLAAGDGEGVLDALGKARQAAAGVSPWFSARVDRMEALLCLSQGDVAGASRWVHASGLDPRDAFDPSAESVYRTLARVLMAEGRWAEALHLLRRLLEMAEAMGATGRMVANLTLQALALQAQGQAEPALAALQRALSLAEPEGYVRTFVDQGEPMGDLLRQAAAQGVQADYVRILLAALKREAAASPTIPAVEPVLVEPLTERELEVLRLLVLGLSNRAIAETLVVAVGTVKQHLKHIYGKLEVRNRTAAASRARELGLV